MNNLFRMTFLAALAWTTFSSHGATITVGAVCGVSGNTPSGSVSANCTGLSGPVVGGLNASEQVELRDHSGQAGYAVTVADYGHLGALVQTFAQHSTESAGYGIGAQSQVSLRYTDLITVQSATLAFGTPVPIQFSYRITGDIGANMGEQGYYRQNAGSYLDAYVRLDIAGGVPLVYSTPCVDAGSIFIVSCAYISQEMGSFDIQYERNIFLQVGRTYNLDVQNSITASLSLDLAQACPNGFCDAGSYVDSSHSFFTYLTPQGGDFQISAESGHNYAIMAVPEPSSYALLVLGLASVMRARRRPSPHSRQSGAQRRLFAFREVTKTRESGSMRSRIE